MLKKGVSFLVEKNRVDGDDKVLRSRWLLGGFRDRFRFNAPFPNYPQQVKVKDYFTTLFLFLYSFGRVVSCMDSTEERKDNKGDKESFSVLLHVLNNSDADTANQQKECDATLPKGKCCCLPSSSPF